METKLGMSLWILLFLFLWSFSGNSAQPHIDRTIKVRGDVIVATTNDNYICATLDWWPAEKCNYNQCPWGESSVLNLDINHPFLASAIKAFTRLRIRIGGSLQDRVVYGMPNLGYPCLPFVKMVDGLFGFSKGCLSLKRWDELNTLFQQTGTTSIPHHTAVTHFSASFAETNRGHYCGRDHPSLSNIRVAAPPYRSSPSLDGRPSIGSSFGSVSYDSPLGPTPSHLSQPLASPDFDPASVILIEKCIKKKSSPEPETECIHFVDANDIADDEDFLEDKTEVIKVDSLHELNPELRSLEPLDLDTLIHPDPNLIKDIPLDKVCMDDINLIPKEANLTLNTLKLNSEDSDLIVSPTKETSNNSDLILNNSDEDNLDLEVSQLDLLHELDPDLIDPKSIELRVMTKHDPIENTNMSLEGRNLKLKYFELNWNNEHSLVLLESILGVASLNLHLKESVLPYWVYHITPPTDWNENISPRFHIVPTSKLDTLPRLLSPIPAGDSLGYVIMVESDDPSSYHTPDSYILPATSSSFLIKDHLSPSWLTLLDFTTATGRLSMTLVETSSRNALVVKDVFIAPPTPIPLNMRTLCHLIL
ncbi:hypothetical protein M5K25_025713 [Dendrobium thyrsiflorum]|uniref:Uncharacterized protein n=1 Tax=Dendrobium thyrsiflorum TaxID=117978 RepID=A0ABD0U4T4_DENTH